MQVNNLKFVDYIWKRLLVAGHFDAEEDEDVDDEEGSDVGDDFEEDASDESEDSVDEFDENDFDDFETPKKRRRGRPRKSKNRSSDSFDDETKKWVSEHIFQ